MRRATAEIIGASNPKQSSGIVVKIPRLVGVTLKDRAISLITDGTAVMGIRMQMPRNRKPGTKNGLWCFIFFKKIILSLINQHFEQLAVVIDSTRLGLVLGMVPNTINPDLPSAHDVCLSAVTDHHNAALGICRQLG
jgi:hypothetical protein